MGRRKPITNTAVKGHRITVTLENPVNDALEANTGNTKRFKSKSHGINYCVAKELGVEMKH